MQLTKKNHLIGLDIGSRSIKVAEAVETKNGFTLMRFGKTDIPAGWILDGQIKEPTLVADAIRKLIAETKIREKNVAISIGGYSVIVKKIQIPFQTLESLQDTIQIEAEQYIPFDISEVNLDFDILGDADPASNRMDVLLVAAKKELVEDVVGVVELAGLRACIVDIDAFALQNIFELSHGIREEAMVLLDIGAHKTTLNIVQNGVSLLTRDVPLGCEQITMKIAKLEGCSFEEAESIKISRKAGKKSTVQEITRIFSEVMSDWCMEIRRAIDFFYSTYPDHQLKGIAISGGGSSISEFSSILAAEIGMSVEVLRPFQAFQIHRKVKEMDFDTISPQAAICLGLSIRRLDDK